MADTPPTPNAPSTPTRAALAEKLDAGTWTADNALAFWSRCAAGEGAKPLGNLVEWFKDRFTGAVAEIVAGDNASERAALHTLVLGDPYQASLRYDEAFFVAKKDARPAVMRRKAVLLALVTPKTSVTTLAEVVKLAPDDNVSLWTLGLMLERLGDLDGATRYLTQLQELEKRTERKSDAAQTLVVLGRIAAAQHQTALSTDHLREAAALYREAGDRIHEGALEKKGQSAVDPSVYDTAAEAYQSAVDLYTQLGDQGETADTLTKLGSVYISRESPAPAEAHLKRAMELYAAAGREADSISAIILRGEARAECDDVDGARSIWEQGLALCAKYGLTEDEADLRKLLAIGVQPDVDAASPPVTPASAAAASTATVAPSKPTASEYPVYSKDYFWERILDQQLTPDDANAIWAGQVASAGDAAKLNYPPSGPDELGNWAVEGDEAVDTEVDFIATVLDINTRGSTDERAVLFMLVGGSFDKAEQKYADIVAQAGDRQAEKFGDMGALFAPSRPTVARKAWERLLKLEPNAHDTRFALGRVLERLDDVDAAEANYRTLIKRAGDDRMVEAAAVAKLANLERRRRNFKSAGRNFERALQLYRDLGDSALVYGMLTMLGFNSKSSGDEPGAEAWYVQALAAAMKTQDAGGVGNALKRLQGVTDEREPAAATVDMVRRASTWSAEKGEKSVAANAALMLGDFARRRGDVESAFKEIDRARAFSQELKDDGGTALAFLLLGHLMIGEKQHDRSDWYFKTAADLFEKVGNHRQAAGAIAMYGWNFLLSGDRDSAREQLHRALARFMNAGMNDAAKELREEMAEAGV